MYVSLAADSISAPFNLSKVTKLRDAVFRPRTLDVGWISLVLQVIANKRRDLRQISVDLPLSLHYLRDNEDHIQTIGEGVLEQWSDLDRVLVHLWESFSIRINVMGRLEGSKGDYLVHALPEMTKRGMVTVDPDE